LYHAANAAATDPAAIASARVGEFNDAAGGTNLPHRNGARP
jgi:hypothetical protein